MRPKEAPCNECWHAHIPGPCPEYPPPPDPTRPAPRNDGAEDFQASLDGMLADVMARPRATCVDCGNEYCGATGPDYVCFECGDRRRKVKEGQDLIDRRLGCIPARYRGATFDDLDTLRRRVTDPRAIDVARDAFATQKVVVLLGPAGCGKTSLAGAMAAQVAKRGKSVAWAPAVRLALARSESDLGKVPTEIRAALGAYLTVIDDVGNEPLVTTSSLVEVVFARHDDERLMLVTTGLQRRQLADRYGGGCARRLLEGALLVELTAKVRAA